MRPVNDQPKSKGGPGPSRMNYRLTRAWAKPAVRNTVVVYLPLAVLGLVGWRLAADDHVRETIQATTSEMMEQIAARPEFAVRQVEVRGTSDGLAASVVETVALAPGTSSLKLDLEHIRASVEALGAVRDARIRLDPDGTLEVHATERQPRALWRNEAGGLVLVDSEGVIIGLAATRAERADLPLVLGEGARPAIGEALDLLAAAPDLRPRIRALVRVGERRWDVVLDKDLIVMLPQEGAVAALARVMSLQEREKVLDRDLAAVDMRLNARPTLRMTPRAVETYRLRSVAGAEGKDT